MPQRIRRLVTIVILGAVASSAAPIHASASPAHAGKLSGVTAKMDGFLTTLTRKGQFQGTVLVIHSGKTLLKKGYGYADVQTGRKNGVNTQFSIGSITKQFTALAILQLQERGQLSVQDPICRYVPSCPAAWQPITLQMLLTHTSGIPDFPTRGTDLSQPLSPDELVARIESKPLDFPPGKRWSYSNSGYDLLGYVIQQVSGESWSAYVEQNILSPARMSHSGFEGATPGPQHATGYATILGSTPIPASPIDPSFVFSAGAIFATVGDLALWDSALSTTKLASQQSLTAMFTPQAPLAPGSPVSYGYGWILTTSGKHQVAFHDGSVPGFMSVNIIDPGDKLTIIVLANDGTADPVDVGFVLGAFALNMKPGIQPLRATVREPAPPPGEGERGLSSRRPPGW